LENNKVFFETIAMMALAVAGIYVSWTANSIMDRQARIEEALAKPILNVEYSKKENSNIISEVSIVNHGSAISNVDIETIPYFYVVVWEEVDDGGWLPKNLLLPIHDIASNIFLLNKQNARTGLIASIANSNATNFIVERMQEFTSLTKEDASSDDVQLGLLSLSYFLRISYTDIFGNETTELFNITTGNICQYFMFAIAYQLESGIQSINTEHFYYKYYTQMHDHLNSDSISSRTVFPLIGDGIEEQYNYLQTALLDSLENKRYLL